MLEKIMAVILLWMLLCVGTSALAENMPLIEWGEEKPEPTATVAPARKEVAKDLYLIEIDGQQFFDTEDAGVVLDYLMTLNYQGWLDLATINNHNGQYYACVRNGFDLLNWSDEGGAVCAHNDAKPVSEISVLFHEGLLVQSSNGAIDTHPEITQLDPPSDKLWMNADSVIIGNAVNPEYVRANAYPNASATVPVDKHNEHLVGSIDAFTNAIVVAYGYLDSRFVLYVALNVASAPPIHAV